MSFNKAKSSKTKSTALPPIFKIRVGRVRASIWENTNENGTFYAATFERVYRDAEGKWQSSQAFDIHETLALAKAADLAHTKMLELQAALFTEEE